jgi:hypothetical protein
MAYQFLFGRPVRATRPSSSKPCSLFVLGAYPSALHVRWVAPEGHVLIQAVAVDNEPEPFWDGSGEDELIARWAEDVGFRSEWGRIAACGKLNGSSGDWVNKHVLQPLNVHRKNAWITDCLNMYCESKGAAAKLRSESLASHIERMSIAGAHHLAHPSESEIVKQAVSEHSARLMTELQMAQPKCIVTLGNAALRVLGGLVKYEGEKIRQLRDDDSYGKKIRIFAAGHESDWVPLAHPAAPRKYQIAHAQWVKSHKSACDSIFRQPAKDR